MAPVAGREATVLTYIDPIESSPNNYRVLLENEHVRVLRMTLKAGESDEQHSHPAMTVCFVKGGKIRIHLPDGQADEADFSDGDVLWHEAWTHRIENIGDSPILSFIVEDKHAP